MVNWCGVEIEVNDYVAVVSGPAQDRDFGRVVEVTGDRALVAWSEGSRTWIDGTQRNIEIYNLFDAAKEAAFGEDA